MKAIEQYIPFVLFSFHVHVLEKEICFFSLVSILDSFGSERFGNAKKSSVRSNDNSK